MKVYRTVKETVVDGPGIRYAIYVSGCEHCCRECHNPETWDFNSGQELSEKLIEEIKNDIASNKMLDGITISGGDPLHPKNLEGTRKLLESLSTLNLNIWLYTGYYLEQIKNDPATRQCLKYIDTLVDGPFIEELKGDKPFRGSSNQHIINLKEIKAFADFKSS